MPKIVDHAELRAQFARAAWSTIVRHGLDGATVRAVADAAGCSTGRLVHYFESKEDLLVHAVRHAQRTMARRFERARRGRRGLEALRAVLLETLPLNSRRRAEWRFWFAFWGQATAHPRLVREQHATHAGFFGAIRTCLADARDAGELELRADLDREARLIMCVIDGTGLIGSFSPRRLSAKQQLEQLDLCLARLVGGTR